METKKCNVCEEEKSLNKFALKNKATGKRIARCKDCMNKVCKELYMSNRTDRKQRQKQKGGVAKMVYACD